MDNKIKKFLNLLGGNYYIFGGMALSKIVKNIYSYDWDIIIDNKHENIESVKKKLKQIFPTANCKPVAFTRSYVGYHTIIYQCGITNDFEELFDIKFEDIQNEPVVVLDGIRYLDIEGLYYNLVESIKDNYELLYDYSISRRKASKQFILQKIKSQIDEIKVWIIEAQEDGDQEAIEEYEDEIDKLNSQDYYEEVKSEIISDLNKLESEKKQAQKLIQKNSDRIRKLKRAVENPDNFSSKYYKELLVQCYQTYNQIQKRVGNIVLTCDKL